MPKQKKGKSGSTRPLSRRSPSWCRYTAEEVEALVVKLSKEGNSLSKIGVLLRDNYGIPLTKVVVGKSVGQILMENNLFPSVPEDLDALLKKASKLRAHLERNRSDRYNRRAVQKVESKIRHLSSYYKNEGLLSKNWKYTPTTFSAI